ncbi:hypothetical protein [Mesoterricola sediminis]|uniref:YHS domain-containing protein n=1 Tax=Mesoterricola sediminis TaxID=2927980 RepID=A0AA48KC86_9BACT|nr:hypothetical protein [Mesoterricola sediminis]BDU75815.1 hypothetical protein METESE_07730 [Mesoterricola sediminis]
MFLPLLPPVHQAPPPAQARPATNTVCPVLGEPVDADSPTVTVRGRRYRVCCEPCKADLAAHPDTYLASDGVPRNHPPARTAAAAPAPPAAIAPLPRSQAPAYLPPQVAGLLSAPAKGQDGHPLPQVWRAAGYDRSRGLASASLFYLPQPLVPEVLTAWKERTDATLRPASPYRMEAAVTWMEPCAKVKASGVSLYRMGTLCVEGVVRDGAGHPVAAFRAETLFAPEQKRLTPGPRAVEAILKQIVAEL